MKRTIYYLVMPLLVFTTGTCVAQTASSKTKTKPPSAVNDPGLTDTTLIANNDAVPAVVGFHVEPNPTKGMLNVKTDCAGYIYFFSQKGKQKGACMVHEGDNMIFLENVLNPGEYVCKFEGVNGSTASTRVMYKP